MPAIPDISFPCMAKVTSLCRCAGLLWLASLPVFAGISARVVKEIDVMPEPEQATISHSGDKLYVSHPRSNVVSILHTSPLRVDRVLRFKALQAPQAVVLTPDDKSLLIGHANGVSIVSLSNHHVENVPGPGAWSLAVTPDGNTVYWAAVHSGLLKFDRRTRRVTTVHAAPAPSYLALGADGKYLHVNYRSGGPGGRAGHDAIGIFDVRTGALLTTITGLANVGGYSVVSPDGRELWASALDACSMARYDHAGCPIVPGELVNIISTRDYGAIATLALPVSTHVEHISFMLDRFAILTGGPGIRFVDIRTRRTLGTLPRLRAGACVPHPKGKYAYATVKNKSAVAMLAFAEQ